MKNLSYPIAAVFAFLPLSLFATPNFTYSAPSGNTTAPAERVNTLKQLKKVDFFLHLPAAAALLQKSTPHNQADVAKWLSSQGSEGQHLLSNFIESRPRYLSGALTYTRADEAQGSKNLLSLLILPRPEWGHDLHRHLAAQGTPFLRKILQLDAEGKIASFHTNLVFKYAGARGVDALNQSLASEETRHTALGVISHTNRSELVPKITYILRDPNIRPGDKVKVLETLQHFDLPQAARAIDSALEDENPAVINQALLSVAALGRTNRSALLRDLLTNSTINQSNLLRALAVSDSPATVAELTRIYMSGTIEEKYAVLDAASHSKERSALRLLVDASMEPNTGLGMKARSLLTSIR